MTEHTPPGAFVSATKTRLVDSVYGRGGTALALGKLWQARIGHPDNRGVSDILHQRGSQARVCTWAWPETLSEGGDAPCYTRPPRSQLGALCDQPLPLAVLRPGRAVADAVASLDPSLSAWVAVCTDECVGQIAKVEVHHVLGGHGTIDVVTAFGRVWVGTSTCPPTVSAAAISAVKTWSW